MSIPAIHRGLKRSTFALILQYAEELKASDPDYEKEGNKMLPSQSKISKLKKDYRSQKSLGYSRKIVD